MSNCVLHPANDVEIGHARLDHQHVCAFLDIQFAFAHRLIAVCRIKIIGFLVAFQQVRR